MVSGASVRVLLAIISCVKFAKDGSNQAVRDTYLKYAANFPDLEYKFFVGDGTPIENGDSDFKTYGLYDGGHVAVGNSLDDTRVTLDDPNTYQPQEDEVVLHCPDDHLYLANKIRAISRYAVINTFDYTFMAIANAYVDIPRLMHSNFEGHDFVGRDEGNYPNGGVWWLSRRASLHLASAHTLDMAADLWVGKILLDCGIKIHGDIRYGVSPQYNEGLLPAQKVPLFPQQDNEQITAKLSESTPYACCLMYEAHEKRFKMDATNDLVIAAAVRYDWPALSAYANSLSKSGFRGTKVVLVQDISELARKNLLDLGFVLVDFNITDRWNPQLTRYAPVVDFLMDRGEFRKTVWAARWEPALEVLKSKDFRYVIWSDIKDVIFQRDPSPWLEKNLSPSKLLGCTEGMNIDGEFYNDGWMKQVAYPDMAAYNDIRKNDICCSGTIAGEASAMRDALSEMNRILTTSPDKPDYEGNLSFLLDQGVWNFIRYSSPLKEITRNPAWDEGFCATVNWFIVHRWTHDPIPEFRDGMLYPKGKSEPFCIVHQYDRDPVWKAAIETRYCGATKPVVAPKPAPEAPRVIRWSKRP